MIFEEKNIIVRLGEGDSEAKITFVEPLESERIKSRELGRQGDFLGLAEIVRGNCLSVENLKDSAENYITVEDIKSGNLRGSYADAIFVGYMQAIFPQEDKDAEEKND